MLTKEYCQSKLREEPLLVALLDEARTAGFRKTLGHMQFATGDSFSICYTIIALKLLTRIVAYMMQRNPSCSVRPVSVKVQTMSTITRLDA